MQPYRYLVKNNIELDFLIDYLKENFIEFHDWVKGFRSDFDSRNVSFFCEYVDDIDYVDDIRYDFTWCTDCSVCKDLGCKTEKYINATVIPVSKLMRKIKLERICNNHIDI